MDRIIEKKKWTTKKIGMLIAITAFLVLVAYLLFFRDRSSKLYVNRDELTIVSVEKSKFQEFIPIDGVVFPKETYYIDAIQGGVVEAIFA